MIDPASIPKEEPTHHAYSHLGHFQDDYRLWDNAQKYPLSALCDHCGGTGNELFNMYHACPKCNGTGVKTVDGTQTKQVDANCVDTQ